jgi:hypothetical protein
MWSDADALAKVNCVFSFVGDPNYMLTTINSRFDFELHRRHEDSRSHSQAIFVANWSKALWVSLSSSLVSHLSQLVASISVQPHVHRSRATRE